MATITAALLAGGCHRTPGDDLIGEKKYMQGTGQLQDGTKVFFILDERQVIPAQKHMPNSFYVEGVIEDGKFVSKSNVMGVGEMAASGEQYGWLELSTVEFHPMESARKAETPFVKGFMTRKKFKPSNREVFNAP